MLGIRSNIRKIDREANKKYIDELSESIALLNEFTESTNECKNEIQDVAEEPTQPEHDNNRQKYRNFDDYLALASNVNANTENGNSKIEKIPERKSYETAMDRIINCPYIEEDTFDGNSNNDAKNSVHETPVEEPGVPAEIREPVPSYKNEEIKSESDTEPKEAFNEKNSIEPKENKNSPKVQKAHKKKKLKPWVKYAGAGMSVMIVLAVSLVTAGNTASKRVGDDNNDEFVPETQISVSDVNTNTGENEIMPDEEPVIIYDANAEANNENENIETEKIDNGPTVPAGIPSDVMAKMGLEQKAEETVMPAGIPTDVLLKMKEAEEKKTTETNDDSESENKDEPIERPEPLGTRGRLYFENGWSVALNYADSYNTDEMQEMADAYDSACYMEDSGKVMIADHASQGFEIIKKYAVGSNATIVDENGKERKIMCTAIYPDAYWEDGYTHLPDGRGIWGSTDGKIGMQTSNNEEGTSVTISYWNYVN